MSKENKKLTMTTLVKRLRADGWRIRDGGWPSTWAAELRWDFFYVNRNLFPRTPEAANAARVKLYKDKETRNAEERLRASRTSWPVG